MEPERTLNGRWSALVNKKRLRVRAEDAGGALQVDRVSMLQQICIENGEKTFWGSWMIEVNQC